jgi:osmotically-inducible protein OsmY
MKTSISRFTCSLAALVPCVLLLAGCNDSNTQSEPSRVNARSAERDSATKTTDADNTGRNVRDRNDATLTAGDQANSPADLEITQKVRKALVNDTGYSMTAKNVKIITTNGKVTLRGPVKSAAEKTGIVSLAKNVAGESNVDDQLEIKTNL